MYINTNGYKSPQKREKMSIIYREEKKKPQNRMDVKRSVSVIPIDLDDQYRLLFVLFFLRTHVQYKTFPT